MATVKEEIAKNLLFYRKKAGFTQKELADKLGVKKYRCFQLGKRL